MRLQHLHATPFRRAIENSVLRKCRQLDVGIEQQLITVQRVQFNELARKAMRPASETDIERLQVFRCKDFINLFNNNNNSLFCFVSCEATKL